ncbi:adenylate kinase [Kitasatospora sp. NPDC056446]|uniref:adenylate kinase n=1 Tax=Kitasatospora sp. NPDC056446 TaxID=3345819 RepID=UPI0036B93A07
MRRIVIAGISGAGKTTLAAALSRRLGIRHIEMDALYHGPDWTRRPEFEDDVRELTEGPAWICDAQYHRIVGDLLGTRADTFVWLDLPRHTVMHRVIRRSLLRATTRRVLWNGNTETWHALLHDPHHPIRWAWTHHATRRTETATFLAAHPHAHVIHLHTAPQARHWLHTLSPAP